MLNAMRFGHLEDATVQAFKALARRVEYTDGIEPTDLQVVPIRVTSIIAESYLILGIPSVKKSIPRISSG